MATPDELRTAIAAGREALRSAISAASAGWERVPAGEGEAGWSARKTAEHAIPTEAFFTTAVCAACGYPGLEEVKGDYPTAADALTQLESVIESCNKLLKHVSVTDLEKKHEKFGTAAELMAFNATHLNEHAAQIRAAAGV
ncbi:MAG: DinB family protein [Dehalococcoidia bacterium]